MLLSHLKALEFNCKMLLLQNFTNLHNKICDYPTLIFKLQLIIVCGARLRKIVVCMPRKECGKPHVKGILREKIYKGKSQQLLCRRVRSILAGDVHTQQATVGFRFVEDVRSVLCSGLVRELAEGEALRTFGLAVSDDSDVGDMPC